MSETEFSRKLRESEEALRARLVAFGWRTQYDTRSSGHDGVEVQGSERSGDYYERDVVTHLRVHECPRCGAAVLDREQHMTWHDNHELDRPRQ